HSQMGGVHRMENGFPFAYLAIGIAAGRFELALEAHHEPLETTGLEIAQIPGRALQAALFPSAPDGAQKHGAAAGAVRFIEEKQLDLSVAQRVETGQVALECASGALAESRGREDAQEFKLGHQATALDTRIVNGLFPEVRLAAFERAAVALPLALQSSSKY